MMLSFGYSKIYNFNTISLYFSKDEYHFLQRKRHPCKYVGTRPKAQPIGMFGSFVIHYLLLDLP